MKRFGKITQRYGEITLLLVMFVGSLAMFLNSFTIQGLSSATDKMGPALMPKVIFGLMTLLAAFLIFDYFRFRRKTVIAKAAQVLSDEEQQTKNESKKREMISLVGIFGFLLLVEKLGFLLTSVAYLIFEFLLLAPKNSSKKRTILLVVLAVAFSAVAYYLFRYQVYVRLPKGIFG